MVTEVRGESRPARWWPGAVVATGLLVVAMLHVVWAFSPWPLADREDFARVVVGVAEDRAPGPGPALVVALLVLAAAYLVAAGSGWLPAVGPAWVHGWGVPVVAGVLLLRGLGGFATSGAAVTGLIDSSTPTDFVHADLALYSPLCVVLGTGAVLVARRALSDRRYPLPR